MTGASAMRTKNLLCTNIGVNFGHFSPRGGQWQEGSR